MRWTPVDGADGYVVELFTAALDTLAVLGPLSAAQVDVPAEIVTGPRAAGALLVKVRALGHGRQLGVSPLQPLGHPLSQDFN